MRCRCCRPRVGSDAMVIPISTLLAHPELTLVEFLLGNTQEAVHGGIGHEQGSSHHPETGSGRLGHYPGQQGRVRRRWRRRSAQAGQTAFLFTHRGGGGYPELQGPSDSSGPDARWVGDKEGSEACARLTRTSLHAFTSAT